MYRQDENNNGNPKTLPLDEAAIGMIAELREQARMAEVGLQSIVMYFARQHGLQGQIQLAPNGKEVILKPMPQGVAR